MNDFTPKEKAILKKQTKIFDLVEERDNLQKKKSEQIDKIRQKLMSEIDYANNSYNPRIEELDELIKIAKEEELIIE